MLKLTYMETNFHLEYLTHSLEDWVQSRVILALRVCQPLCVEPSTASFLLPVDLLGLEKLQAEAKSEDREVFSLCVCDSECVEVTLKGAWLSNGCEDANGLFVTAINDRTEFFLHKLWLEAQSCASVMSD